MERGVLGTRRRKASPTLGAEHAHRAMDTPRGIWHLPLTCYYPNLIRGTNWFFKDAGRRLPSLYIDDPTSTVRPTSLLPSILALRDQTSSPRL